MTKIKKAYPLIVVALIFLFNPNANLIDVLPDIASYVLLIVAIGNLTETVPYLAECKGALVKLSLVALVKIPAFTVMYSNMSFGKDIVPLFTLVFVTLELILLYSAVSNAYNALSYLGERTDSKSVRDPFPIGRGKTATPEQLRSLTYIFFAARGILNVVPEILLLTPEDTSLRKRLAEAYPAVLVLCIIASLIIGCIWLKHALKYASAIKRGADLSDAIRSLEHVGSEEEISTKDKLKKLTVSLTLLSISSLFIFDITISDFGGYNILPHFIYGILLFTALYNVSTKASIKKYLLVSTAGYSLSSLIGYLYTVRFFDSYTYVDIEYSASARGAYLPVKILAVIELLFALLMLLSAAVATVDFIKEHTDVSPSDPSYSKTNEKNHRSTIIGTLPIFVISAIIALLKCANVFIKQSSVIIGTAINNEGIPTSGVPAMDTIIFLASIIYVICCFVKSSNLKDEVNFKYGKE